MRIPTEVGGGRAVARGPVMPEVTQAGQRTEAALGRAGQTAGAIANDLLREEAERKAAADRLVAGKALLDYRAKTADLIRATKDKLASGELASEDDARAHFEESMADLDAVDLPGVGRDAKQGLQEVLAGERQKVTFGFDDVLRGYRGAQVKKTALSSLDAIGRQAISPDANMGAIEAQIDATISTASKAGTDVDPAWLDGQGRAAKAGAWASNAARRIELGESSMDELKAIENDLTAKDGRYAGKLDADSANMLLARARSQKDRLTARWEAAAAKRDASARRVLDQYQQVYSSGFPVGDELREQARQATKGTEYEQAFTDAMADEQAVGEMLKMPVADQQAFIVQRERELRTGKVNDPKEIRRYNALATAFGQNIKAMTDSPMEWQETRTGQELPRISAPMLLSSDGVGTAVKILQDRVVTLDATTKQSGVPVKAPLFKEEAEQLGAIVKAQSPTERARTLGVLAKGIGDQQVYKAAVKQLLGDDPRAFAAGIAHGMDLRTTEGRKVGEMIEQGSAILRDKSVISPKAGSADDGTLAAFNSYITASMVPMGSQQRDLYYQSALSIYAKLAAEDGKLGQQLDTKTFERAVRIATGGVVEYRGQPMIPPRYGMSGDEFEQKLDAGLMSAAKANGIDYDLRDMRLVADDAVPGRYYVMADAIHPQRDKNGMALFVEVK